MRVSVSRRMVLATILFAVAACSGSASRLPRTPASAAPGSPLPRGALPARPQARQRFPDGRPPRDLKGSSAWKLTKPATDRPSGHSQIEGYADPISVLPGGTASLMVSTSASRFRVRAYRIGGYHGGEGRLIWSSGDQHGSQQPAPGLLPSTRTVVAHWTPSLTVTTRAWPPGFYLFKLIASSGYQSYIPFTVRSPDVRGRIVLSAPVIDWQAYNSWGGYDLYQAPPGRQRSWAVSFDRPFVAGVASGAGQFVYNVVPPVVLAERLGLPLAYETDIDVAVQPHLLDGATGYVTLGHDEYWTVAERRYVTAARDAGTNLAFLSANTLYWRVRLRAAPSGADRIVVGYKADAATSDPMRHIHPAQTTARWRDPPHPDPENSLTGTLYECFPVDAPYRVVSPGWWGFHNTGVHRGSEFPHLIADEADRVYPIASTPRPLQILSYTPYSCEGTPTSSESTYYTTTSGAGVIDFGTQRWPCALRPRCPTLPPADDRFARTVTTNVLKAFARGPVGRREPAHDNVAHFNLPTTNQVPAS